MMAGSVVCALPVFALRESSARRHAEEATASIDALRHNERLHVYWPTASGATSLARSSRRPYATVSQASRYDDSRGRRLARVEWNYLWKKATHRGSYLVSIRISRNVAFSSDGKFIASPGYSGKIRIFDMAYRRTATRTARKGTVQCVAFQPDGRVLAVAKRDGWLNLWDWNSRRLLGSG